MLELFFFFFNNKNKNIILMDSHHKTILNDFKILKILSSKKRRSKKIYKSRFNPMDLDEHVFRRKYRFSKANMKKIIDLLRTDLEGSSRGGHIPPDLQVMAAIRYWGRNEMQDDGADIHGFSQPTLCTITQRVARLLASKRPQFVKMPQSIMEQINIMEGFKAIRGLPNVIGAIDCTHIKIPKVGGSSGQFYVNRKGYYSINTQVVCDSNLKIRDIVCHWRGSTHDSRIFRESRIKQKFENGDFKGVLLGDGGYACSNIIYTPLLNPQTNSEVRYNIAQIATRNTIERCFGVWKSRFRILLSGFRCSLENIKTTVIALAVLHNLAIDLQDTISDEAEEEFIEEFPQNQADDDLINNSNTNLSRRVYIEQIFNSENSII